MTVIKKTKVFTSVNEFEKFYFPKSSEIRKKMNLNNHDTEDPLKTTKKVIKASMLKIKKQFLVQ